MKSTIKKKSGSVKTGAPARRLDLLEAELTAAERAKWDGNDQRFGIDLRAETLEYVEAISGVSGLPVGTVVLRAIGEGLAGDLRQNEDPPVVSNSLIGEVESLNGRRLVVRIRGQAMAMAERAARHVPDEDGAPSAVRDLLSVWLWNGIVTAEFEWLGHRQWGSMGEGKIVADVTSSKTISTQKAAVTQ